MKKICAICGVKDAETRDHIPPKSLYPKPRNNDINLNTIPACRECNNQASADDEEFKLIIGIATGDNQPEQSKLIDSLASTIYSNKRLANNIFYSSKNVFSQIKGPLLEPAVAIEFERAKYERVIKRIVKGIFWMKTGNCLPSSCKISVYPGDELDSEIVRKFFDILLSIPLESLNKETFTYRAFFDDDGCGVFGMQFFEKHMAFAISSLD